MVLIVSMTLSVTTWAQTPQNVVEVQPAGGFHPEEVIVSLFAPKGDIYYTTNGNEPTRSSVRYTQPFTIDKTTVLRAVAYRGGTKSPVATHTYFINEPESTIPVVSLGIPPHQLFNPAYGLFVEGTKVDTTHPSKFGSNYWSRRELAVNVEIFENNEREVFNSKTGFKIFGGVSRTFPQKSFSISMDGTYGQELIEYPLFGESGPKKVKHLVFRNSGSDFGKSHMRDAYMTSLTRNMDIESQRYRPVHMYINGVYWGIYNMREKVNRYFLDTYYALDRDSLDILEGRSMIKSGYRGEYLKLKRYARENDLAQTEHYNYIQKKIDINNFIDYYCAQIFFNNRDAGGNIKFWRSQNATAKWRWILYDTDFGFGLHDPKGYRDNSIEFFTEANGPRYPNPPWTTFWLRNLLKNEEFKQKFVNRFQDHLNTTFESKRMLKHLYGMVNLYAPEIDRHLDRWNRSKKRRDIHLGIMERFALRRPEYVFDDLSEFFDLGDLIPISIEPSDHGTLVLNQYLDIEESYKGQYFKGSKIILQAYPNYGYRFSHWEGIKDEPMDHKITVDLSTYESANIKPVFELYENDIKGKIIFNEINAYSQDIGDWIELFNTSTETVNVGNWILTDTKNEYRLPDMFINPGEYLIVSQDTALFKSKFNSDDINVIGEIPFGLNKRKEYIALYDHNGASIDSLSYTIEPIDTAFTMSLLLPDLNNADIENWELRKGLGTPNAENPYLLESRIKAKQTMWMQVGSIGGFMMLLVLMLVYQRKSRRT